jgi:type I restriction enzyme S subunit
MAALELITENIDLWTSAIRVKPTQGRGSNKKLELYGIKKLRELILELAVRGKLVPQDPNDEPASVLLEQIAADKARWAKEKNIKIPRKLAEISDGEKPFELPNGWSWARFGEIFDIEYGDNLPEVKRSNTGEYPVYGSNGVVGSHEKCSVSQPCIVIGRKGSAGALNLCLNEGCWVTDVAYSLVPPSGLDLNFTFKLLHTLGLENLGKGIKPGLSRNEANILLICVPPIEEQYRIDEKVDELLALCDQLEKQTEVSFEAHQLLVETLLEPLASAKDASELRENWARLSEHFDTLITTDYAVEKLKQIILQLAVMGKLVPQDPNDEPASELLKRIAAEKSQLINDQKIKKQNPLPEITDEEKPFSLPSGWVWSRIGESSLYSEYGISAKTFDTEDGIPVLKMGDIQSGKVVLGGQKKASIDFKGISGLMLNHGDILYNRTNSAELVGKTGRYEGPDNHYSFASYLIRIRCSENNVCSEFLNLNMNSPLFRVTQVEPYLKQQCGQANINGTIMKNMIVAIAPLSEQKRIVSKVNNLTILLENLKFRLQASRNAQARLSEAIVDQFLLTHG